MTSKAEAAYRAWRRAAERGYGRTTTISDQNRIDAKIRRLKEKYETLLLSSKTNPRGHMIPVKLVMSVNGVVKVMVSPRHMKRNPASGMGTGSPTFSKSKGPWSTIPGGGYYYTKVEAKKAAISWGRENGLDEVMIYQQGSSKSGEYVKIPKGKR